LVLSPKPGNDGFLDVLDGLLFVFSLGDTPGESRTFGNYPTVIGCLKGDVKKPGKGPRAMG
jgi:hypothetical protein